MLQIVMLLGKDCNLTLMNFAEKNVLNCRPGRYLLRYTCYGAESPIIILHLGMAWWFYIFGIAYPGLSLSLIRSFTEHRPSEIADHRTAIVEAGAFWSLLFLNNNLHVVHHNHPGTAWYLLSGIYRANRDEIIKNNGGYLFNSYGKILSRYFVKPKDSPIYRI